MIDDASQVQSYSRQGDEDRTAGLYSGRAARAYASRNGQVADSGDMPAPDKATFAKLLQGSTGTAGTASTAAAAPVRETAPTESLHIVVPRPNNDGEQRTAGSSAPQTDTKAAPSDGSTKKHGSFWDFIVGIFDILNPLEHIPVISTIYAKITGHKISPMARIAGDTLYGGPIGAAVGVANVVSEKETGKDLGENVMAMFHKKSAAPKADDGSDLAAVTGSLPKVNIAWNDAPATTNAPAAIPAADQNAHVALRSQQGYRPKIAPPQLVAPQNAIPTPAAAPAHVRTNLISDAAKDVQAVATNNVSTFPTRRFNPLPPRIHVSENQPSALTRPPRTATGSNAAKPSLTAASAQPSLLAQEAPADAPQNQVIPPELIAQKMMAGLDKYAAMKQSSMVTAQPSAGLQ